jgi:4'-phosphopantetheinyl transferase
LGPDETAAKAVVRLWTVDLHSLDVDGDRLLALLPREEHLRARAPSSGVVPHRFVAARAALRAVLGDLTGAEPASVPLSTGPHGKPELPGRGSLRFNVSHSGGLALVAVASGREVGVDVERIRPRARIDGIAARSFSAEEQQALADTRDSARLDHFYALWTAREAFVKATGRGLATPSDSFRLPPWPAGTEVPAAVEERGSAEHGFSLLRLALATGYSGALVARGRDWRVERCALPAALCAP